MQWHCDVDRRRKAPSFSQFGAPSMNRSASLLSAAVLLAATLLPSPAHAAESYDNCTAFIETLPATISTQGTWCLKADLATSQTSGAAITIATNNVTIDCNDFKIGGLAAGVGTAASGIFASERLNATVRRCNIRGFKYGVQFQNTDNGGHVVEDSRFDANTYAGIAVAGDGSVVRGNAVRDTGGSTLTPGSAFAISTTGSVDVRDNLVSGVAPAPNAGGFAIPYGIYTYGNPDGSISGNTVRGLVTAGAGVARAIYNVSSGRISLVDNRVIGNGGGTGLACTNATARAKGNAISGFLTDMLSCGDAGGNDFN
jgi:hypothetical protein